MHPIIRAGRGNLVVWLALFVALGGAVVPAIASATCVAPTKPPHCWEAGIEPTSGACGTYLTEREHEEHLYEQCLQSELEIRERGNANGLKPIDKYEERLHEIAEEQKRYEQQQAEAKYAREHPTSPPPSPVSPVQPEAVFPPLTLTGSSSFVKSFINSRSHGRAAHLSDKCRLTGTQTARCQATWYSALHVTATSSKYAGQFSIDARDEPVTLSFTGTRAEVGCLRSHSAKHCASKVHWKS